MSDMPKDAWTEKFQAMTPHEQEQEAIRMHGIYLKNIERHYARSAEWAKTCDEEVAKAEHLRAQVATLEAALEQSRFDGDKARAQLGAAEAALVESRAGEARLREALDIHREHRPDCRFKEFSYPYCEEVEDGKAEDGNPAGVCDCWDLYAAELIVSPNPASSWLAAMERAARAGAFRQAIDIVTNEISQPDGSLDKAAHLLGNWEREADPPTPAPVERLETQRDWALAHCSLCLNVHRPGECQGLSNPVGRNEKETT